MNSASGQRRRPALPAAQILARLMQPRDRDQSSSVAPSKFESVNFNSAYDRPALSLKSVNRQGVSLRLHAASGASEAELVRHFKAALKYLRETGHRLD